MGADTGEEDVTTHLTLVGSIHPPRNFPAQYDKVISLVDHGDLLSVGDLGTLSQHRCTYIQEGIAYGLREIRKQGLKLQ